MKRLFLALLFIGASLPAYAQGQQQCFTTTDQNCIPVGPGITGRANKPLPVQIISSNTITISANSSTPVSVNAGFSQQISSTPVIQAAAYSAGNCIGGFNAITVSQNNGQSGFVTHFRAVSIVGATPTLTIFLFDSQPTTSTCTDRGTFSLSAADTDKMIGPPTAITLALPTNVTSPSSVSLDLTPPRPFIAGGSTTSGVKTIYYGMVTSAITPSSVSDIHTRTGVLLN